jgi:hypothetical protein
MSFITRPIARFMLRRINPEREWLALALVRARKRHQRVSDMVSRLGYLNRKAWLWERFL